MERTAFHDLTLAAFSASTGQPLRTQYYQPRRRDHAPRPRGLLDTLGLDVAALAPRALALAAPERVVSAFDAG